MGLLEIAELADNAADGVCGCSAGLGQLSGVGEQVAHLTQQAKRHAQAAGHEIAQGFAAAGLRLLAGCGDVVSVVRRALGRVGSKVEKFKTQLHAAFAVGDGVVQLLNERAFAAAQTFDQGELPQRAGPVEWVGGDDAGEVEQLAKVAGLGQRNVANVVLQVEVGIVDPHRRREVGGCGLYALAKTGHHVSGALHGAHDAVHVGSLVEDGHVGKRGRQVRVFLHPPHQAFGIRHLVVEGGRVGHSQRGYAVCGSALPGAQGRCWT